MSRLSRAILVIVTMACGALAQPCPCDCDDDRRVRVHELATGINIALERMEASRCPAADGDGNSEVEVNELVSGVDAALHGCVAPTPTPVPDGRPTQAELDAARAAWNAAGYTHYEYRYFLGCFCFGPHDVELEVLNGKVVAIRDPATGRDLNVEFADLYLSVDQLFDRIQSDLVGTHRLDVQFDTETGHPTEYSVDPVRELADDELTVRIDNLRPVEGSCTNADECDSFAEICVDPGGFVGCGACFDAMSDCDTDSDCDGEPQICQRIGLKPGSCACDPSVRVCQPGCTTDSDCPFGTTCDPDHHCVPPRCIDDSTCPDNFTCLFAPDARTGSCLRTHCPDLGQCADDGFCVNGRCYPRPGRCGVVPP